MRRTLPYFSKTAQKISGSIEGMLGTARTEVIVRADALDLTVFRSQAIIDIIKEALMRNRRFEVMLLIDDEMYLVQNCPRLTTLAKRAPSVVSIRIPDEETDRALGIEIVVDSKHHFYQPYDTRDNFILTMDDRATAHQKRRDFMHEWKISHESAEVRKIDG